jgi:hypothetical protein
VTALEAQVAIRTAIEARQEMGADATPGVYAVLDAAGMITGYSPVLYIRTQSLGVYQKRICTLFI